MSQAGNKPGEKPNEADDALSATGMFLGGFQTEPDTFELADSASAPSVPRTTPREAGPGEFTQMFDPSLPKSAAEAPRSTVGPGEVTRLFATAPAAPQPLPTAPAATPAATPTAQKMRGFSSPGASGSASAEGSFTQVFRSPAAARPPLPMRPTPPAPPVENREWPSAFEVEPGNPQPSPPLASPGVTELFRALSGDERPPSEQVVAAPAPFSRPKPPEPAAPHESFTMLLQRLTENAPASQNSVTQRFAPTPAPSGGQGEFTRIITREVAPGASVSSTPHPAADAKAPSLSPVPLTEPKLALPATPAVPKLAPPAGAPPKTKLQEMMPILLILNLFLMAVLIVIAVFALMRR